MRLSGRSTPNPVRRNTTRAGHNQHQGPHGNRSQTNMRQFSVDPSVLQRNNTNVISTIQQHQHSSAPQTPLAGENERHITLTRQKSLVNNGTTNSDNEPQVIWVEAWPCVTSLHERVRLPVLSYDCMCMVPSLLLNQGSLCDVPSDWEGRKVAQNPEDSICYILNSAAGGLCATAGLDRWDCQSSHTEMKFMWRSELMETGV
jgi:hypothetical protein